MLKKFACTVFVAGLLLVVVLSVIPAKAFPNLEIRDIFGHTAAYAALAFGGGMAFRTARAFLVLAAGLVFLGAGLELLQGLLPSRDASGYEFLADVIGIALGLTAVVAINTFTNRFP